MIVIIVSLVSGLVKAKKYDWKDSNMALFGSDTEKQVKSEYTSIIYRSKYSTLLSI